MWGQSWENIYDLVAPFDNAKLIDLSPTLEDNIDNVTEMFRYAENFFTSLDLYKMTDDFWDKSMFVEPENATAVCHASAWDFLSVNEAGPIKEGDFRIKMCTDRNQEDFITIHHEMGHIEYQMAYSQVSEDDPTLRPLIFRDGANPGDTIALSVSTASHLEGLQNDIIARQPMSSVQKTDSTTEVPEVDPYERDINQLMRTALEKIAFIPYAYILDKFRWDVFAGEYGADEYNYQWWKLR
ncbi:Peptidase M2 peptidyl-dipeptidase A, partial [Trinorchestia longiramus]